VIRALVASACSFSCSTSSKAKKYQQRWRKQEDPNVSDGHFMVGPVNLFTSLLALQVCWVLHGWRIGGTILDAIFEYTSFLELCMSGLTNTHVTDFSVVTYVKPVSGGNVKLSLIFESLNGQALTSWFLEGTSMYVNKSLEILLKAFGIDCFPLYQPTAKTANEKFCSFPVRWPCIAQLAIKSGM